MVQVIVQRQNQKATVDCSKVKGYVLGNGPSRAHLNLDELQKENLVPNLYRVHYNHKQYHLFSIRLCLNVVYLDHYPKHML